MQTYEYVIVGGPDSDIIAKSLFKGSSVYFCVQKKFGNMSEEFWNVIIDSVKVRDDDDRAAEIFQLTGRIIASGSDPAHLSRGISHCIFSGFWNKKEKMSHIEVTVV